MNYSQYDKIASKYDSLFRDEMSLVENREVGEKLPPLSGSILDIGCGTGLLTEIAEIDPQEYLGVDPSKGMLEQFINKHPEYKERVVCEPFDGYTMPIVTIWDEKLQKYVIIDGFHRNLVIRKFADINERCCGKLPIVVLDKYIDQRMASTVRHNRARGSHSVDGMVNIVFNMLRDGVSEREICEKVGLEQKELVKLKYVTGFAKIFKNYKYNAAIEKVVDERRVARETAKKKEEEKK